ncbi:MAG TPA: sigma factor-like helix-turn-helix DNA-binding protein [Kofleriaceae bacterium]|nr:sigma factor-like helix-turn-helix DNA-binding protein [Kofleriaceae bacterium]
MSLASRFAQLGVPHDAAAVEQRLAAALADAQARWPEVALPADAWLAWIEGRLPQPTASLEAALDGLRLVDLYLACACARGDARALAAFDRAYLDPDTRISDDTKQQLRHKLFVADPEGPPPRIALYAGRGDLGRWVKAALVRMTIDEARSAREVPTEDSLIDALGIDPAASPELAQLKQDARAVVQAAFREAIAALSDRERTLLLQYYVDGVGIVALGKLFGIAPSNVSRSLAKARIALLSQVRRALLRARQIHGDELESLVELVRSQLSLTGALRE